jgi:hypothetical protein
VGQPPQQPRTVSVIVLGVMAVAVRVVVLGARWSRR